MDLSQIVLFVILGLGLVGFILAIVFKKNFVSYLTLSTPILKAIYNVLTATYQIFPNETWKKIVSIAQATIEGVQYAEQLWKAGSLDKEKREEAANTYIKLMLNTANIEITDTVQGLITGIIKVICAIMPHADEVKQI